MSSQRTDHDLIRLLAHRIEAARNDSRSLDEQVRGATADLELHGVPETLWRSVVVGCAAMAHSNVVATECAQRTIVLVGGRGEMGQFLVNRFEQAGHRVRILDRADWADASRLLAGAHLALVCVPIEVTDQVIERLGPQLDDETVLADITSIKAPYVTAMLKHHDGPVIGLHPMFGPGVDTFLAQRVVVCPGRDRDACQWLLDLLRADGARLVEATPEEHDAAMVSVQAIRHFTTFSLGAFLAGEGDVRRTLEFASPIYRLEFDMVERLFAQDAALYIDIMLATPERREAIRRLAQCFNEMADLADRGDRQALISAFDDVRSSLGSEPERALRESGFIVDALTMLMASES